MADPEWMDKVRERLNTTLSSKNDAEDLVRVLFYLSEAEDAYKDDPDKRVHPAWKTLRSALSSSEEVFKLYAKRLAEDTKKAETDLIFRQKMGRLYDMLLEISDEPVSENQAQGFELARLVTRDATTTSGFAGFARSLQLIPKDQQAQILGVVSRFCPKGPYFAAVDDLVTAVNQVGGNLVMVGLAALYLGWEVCDSIRRWWKGEISGVRCLKIISDSTVTIAAGVGGGMVGSTIGMCVAGPVGTIVGGVVGGILGSSGANVFIDRLTQWIFGVPREVSLENAYNYLGVAMTASNHAINQNYRNLCLKYHPDKNGGSKEEFQILQFNMAVVKAARGEL